MKMKKEKIVITLGLIFILGGCYTQLKLFDDNYYTGNPDEITYDSTGRAQIVQRDTVVVKDREVCYWRRTLIGNWELRCYKSNYSDYWHSYYNRPWWWYGSYGSTFNPYYYHCPYHTYYHPSCEYCWYYSDRYQHVYIHHIHDTSGVNNNIGSSSSTTERHSIRPTQSTRRRSKTSSILTKTSKKNGTVHTQSGTKRVKKVNSNGRRQLRPVDKEKKKEDATTTQKTDLQQDSQTNKANSDINRNTIDLDNGTNTNSNQNTSTHKDQGTKKWKGKRRSPRKKR